MNRYLLTESATVTEMSRWVMLSRSVFYYKAKDGKPGAKPSTHTRALCGELVSNEILVEEIKVILSQEFADYGYEITAAVLKRDYTINKKKVYRLMDENNLLLNKAIKTSGKRNFVKFRTIDAAYPMEYLSMDIKYIWVHGEKRNYYLLSVIDVYSKRVIHSVLKRSIRKKDVIDFLKAINDKNAIKGVTIRNDNGPQFIANQVKKFLRLAEVHQEFSHPATPEENSYIEAFHSILDRAVVQRFEFESYYEAKQTIERFIQQYNEYRPHRTVGMMTPMQKWNHGMAERTSVMQQNAREMLSRPDSDGQDAESALYSLDNINKEYLCRTEDRSSVGNFNNLYLNQINESVQFIGG